MKSGVIILTVVLTAALLTGGAAFAAGDAAAGKELYAKKCASCHGANGEGKDALAKALKVEIKALGSKEVQAKSDTVLTKDMKEGMGKMKAVADMKDKDHLDVIAFLRTLAKK